MKRKSKVVRKKNKIKQKRQPEMIVDMNQSYSGQDEFAFELADDDDGFVFEADFESE